jgi:anthranilate synthase component 1/salicylate synthetase
MRAGIDLIRYRQARVPLAEEPLLLIARLARSGLFEEYVAYEQGPDWFFAGGALAHIRLTRAEAELRSGSYVRRIPRGTGLTALDELLPLLPIEDWRLYGWAAFELADTMAGRHHAHGRKDLLALIVPETEVTITDGQILVRCADEQQLERITELLRPPAPASTRPIRKADLRIEDNGSYRIAVAAAVAAIHAGTLAKTIISRVVPVAAPIDLVATLVEGRRANTPARSFLLNLDSMTATGFSPETVAEVTADGRVTTRPLAGTRARTGSAPDDARLRAELLADPKEVYEHAASVKLACEELESVCETVRVEEFMTVQARGSVQHLASMVTGQLKQGQGPWHAFSALFPAITASGIPKRPACDLIATLEGPPRGLYAGAVLTCDSKGNLDAALVLRSVFQEDGHTWLQAGAGIVSQSRPEREHEETCEKLRSVAPYLVLAD